MTMPSPTERAGACKHPTTDTAKPKCLQGNGSSGPDAAMRQRNSRQEGTRCTNTLPPSVLAALPAGRGQVHYHLTPNHARCVAGRKGPGELTPYPYPCRLRCQWEGARCTNTLPPKVPAVLPAGRGQVH
eukprot:gene877-biopygen1867